MRATWIVFAILSTIQSGAFAASPASPDRTLVCNAIRSAIHARFGSALKFDDREVEVLGKTSGVSAGKVSVERVSLDPRSGLIEVRLKCASAGCLPFYAFVTPRTSTASNDRKLDSNSPLRLARAVTSSGAPDLRAGSRMLLVIATPTMRLSLPAVSLETRHMGEAVRVRRVGDPRVINAIVRGPGFAVAQEL